MNYTIQSALLVICFCFSSGANAVSFTADAIQLRGKAVGHAKMFWSDGNVRFEYLDQGVPIVQIFDNREKQVIWLDTNKKVYMQRELTEQQTVPDITDPEKKYDPCESFTNAQCTKLKSTELNGRQTDKWLITLSVGGRDQHVFQWIDQKHQILVRQENPDGSILDVNIRDDQEVNGRQVRKIDMIAIAPDGSSVHGIQWYDEELNIVVRQQTDDGSIDELRNIKVEEIDPKLFAIPKDYQSVESQLSNLNAAPGLSFDSADN